MTREWTDMLVGARMRVDSEFSSEIDNSRFSRQEWGLIMTAVEFDVEHPDDPDRATLVADTSRVADIMPEVERAAEMQGMAGAGGARGNRGSSGEGILDTLRDALGLGGGFGRSGGVDREKVSAAVSLVEAYTTRLQSHLETQGRWEEVRQAAGEDPENAGGDPENAGGDPENAGGDPENAGGDPE